MKTSKLFRLFLALSCICLYSCSTHRSTLATTRKSDALKALELPNTCFVQWKDGSIEEFESLELKTSPFKSPYLLANGTEPIAASRIEAYQTKHYYAISQNLLKSGRKTFVAVNALPGFAIRVQKGDINVYVKKFNKGQGLVDEFFIQKGGMGALYPCTEERMAALVQEKPEQFQSVYRHIALTGKHKKLDQMARQAKLEGTFTHTR